MQSTITERIKELIKGLDENTNSFASKIGVSQSTIATALKRNKGVNSELIEKIFIAFPIVNYDWLISGKGEMFKSTEISQEVTLISNPNIIMVPIVGQYAYAGYLCGFQDSDYMETLPQIPVIADHELKGDYLGFEVRGDSMDNGSDESLKEGDLLVSRIVKQDYWRYKLHINQWDFVIVHKTEGILIKRIIEHDVETGNITLHSLNPLYKDRVINLNDVAQLFNVVQVLRSRRR